MQGGSGYGSTWDCWLAQTGDVPAGVNSLLFESDWQDGGPLTVSLNGVQLATSVFSSGPTVNSEPIETYIANVSAFADQDNVTLEFHVRQTSSPTST